MRKYLFIGCGGFLGAICRYLAEQVPIYHYHENIPLDTLIINVSGSFLLALILTTALEVRAVDSDLRLGLATGLLGAYTTFSTLSKEVVTLMGSGDYFSAVSYLTVSVALGLGTIYFGTVAARKVGAILWKKDGDDAAGERE